MGERTEDKLGPPQMEDGACAARREECESDGGRPRLDCDRQGLTLPCSERSGKAGARQDECSKADQQPVVSHVRSSPRAQFSTIFGGFTCHSPVFL